MDKSEWPTIVQPIQLEEHVEVAVYQNEKGYPLLRIEFESLDCAVWLTPDAASLIGHMALQAKEDYVHKHVQ
jgi:hypothetical protein